MRKRWRSPQLRHLNRLPDLPKRMPSIESPISTHTSNDVKFLVTDLTRQIYLSQYHFVTRKWCEHLPTHMHYSDNAYIVSLYSRIAGRLRLHGMQDRLPHNRVHQRGRRGGHRGGPQGPLRPLLADQDRRRRRRFPLCAPVGFPVSSSNCARFSAQLGVPGVRGRGALV